jgi:hypothetical protein
MTLSPVELVRTRVANRPRSDIAGNQMFEGKNVFSFTHRLLSLTGGYIELYAATLYYRQLSLMLVLVSVNMTLLI